MRRKRNSSSNCTSVYLPMDVALKASTVLTEAFGDRPADGLSRMIDDGRLGRKIGGSSQANLFASISAGICALWGPLHGGANQKVIEMLERIREDGGNYKKYVEMAKDKKSSFRLMGFGHRVYKNFDPRAKILKQAADEVLGELGIQDPLLELAKNLEQIALEDDYFVEKKLYPNVDFYSGTIYQAMGIPTNMFTVMFALGRLPGWIAHWKEMKAVPGRWIPTLAVQNAL